MAIKNVWEEYGFASNPYEPTPLPPTGEMAELFVGREEELEQLGTFLVSEDRGGIFVEGHIGVGKTTLVNMAQHHVRSETRHATLLPSVRVVEVQNGMSSEIFLLTVLSNALQSLRHLMPNVAKDKEYQRLNGVVAQGLLRSGAANLNVGPVGFGGGKALQPTTPEAMPLPTIQGHLGELQALASTHGFDKLVMTVNNLDVVDPAFFAELMHAVRDSTLTVTGILWVFVGPVGIRSLIEQRARRVSELLVSQPVRLGPLTLQQVLAITQARLKRFRATPKALKPVEESVIEFLYMSSKGEVRYVLNRASDVVRRIAAVLPSPKTLTVDDARPLLKAVAESNIRGASLTKKEEEVLGLLAKRGVAQGKDFEAFGFTTPQNLTNYLLALHAKQLLDREEQGRESKYYPRGDARIYYGT